MAKLEKVKFDGNHKLLIGKKYRNWRLEDIPDNWFLWFYNQKKNPQVRAIRRGIGYEQKLLVYIEENILDNYSVCKECGAIAARETHNARGTNHRGEDFSVSNMECLLCKSQFCD